MPSYIWVYWCLLKWNVFSTNPEFLPKYPHSCLSLSLWVTHLHALHQTSCCQLLFFPLLLPSQPHPTPVPTETPHWELLLNSLNRPSGQSDVKISFVPCAGLVPAAKSELKLFLGKSISEHNLWNDWFQVPRAPACPAHQPTAIEGALPP